MRRHRLKKSASGQDSESPQRERGVAMLMVLALVTTVSIVVVDLQYNSFVDLKMSYHARDELQAEYNALSALRLRALLLKHSRKINTVVQSLMGLMGGGSSGGINIGQILEMVPVECGLMSAILSQESHEGGDFFPGDCIANSTSEHAKISVNQLRALNKAKRDAITRLLYGLLADPRLMRHFEEDDRNGVHAENPIELVEAIIDWVDADNNRAGNMTSDEESPYGNLRDAYSPKNAAFDSVDEIQLVHGVDDELFDLIRDAVSIYTDSGQIELGTAPIERIVMWGIPALLQEGMLADQLMLHPGFVPFLQDLVNLKGMGMMMGAGVLNTKTLKDLLIAHGLHTMLDVNAIGSIFSDKTQTAWFTIESEGRVGNATRKIKAVFQAFESQFYYARVE